MRTQQYLSKTRSVLPLLGGLLMISCGAPMSSEDGSPSDEVAHEQKELPVVFEFYGAFDGSRMQLWRMDGSELGQPIEAPSVSSSGLGQARQELVEIPSQNYGTGISGTTADLIALEQVSFAVRPGAAAWPATGCGAEPALGVCANVRMRNMFSAFDLVRGYVEMVTLTPTGQTTSVSVLPPAADTDTSPSEPSLGVSGIGGGLWRYGHVGVDSDVGNGPGRWWAFTGTTTGTSLTFTFNGRVVGVQQSPTVRASLVDGSLDAAPFYGNRGTPASGGIQNTGIDLSSDGQWAVFSSTARNLHSAATAAGYARIFRKNMTTGAIDYVSRAIDTGADPASGCNSVRPSISDDGDTVAFESTCVMDAGITYPSSRQVYVHTVSTGTTRLLTYATGDDPNSPTTAGNNVSWYAHISGNGQFVTFQSRAGNIITGRPAGRSLNDVYRYDLAADTLVRANVPNGLSASNPAVTWPNQQQRFPRISDDGRYVVYESAATNLVPPDVFNREIWLYDVSGSLSGGTAITTRMSAQSDGSALGSNSVCSVPSISGDGAMVGFACTVGAAGDALVAAPSTTLGRRHVYVRTIGSAASIEMVDVSVDGSAEGNANTADIRPEFSTDNRLVAYVTSATNLTRTTGCVPGSCVTFSGQNVFVRDRTSVDPALQRSFAASLIRTGNDTLQPNFVGISGNLSGDIAMAGPFDAAVVGFAGAFTGANWSQLPTGWIQMFVAPATDGLFQ